MAASLPRFVAASQPGPGAVPTASPHAPSVGLPLRFVVTGVLACCTGVVFLLARPDLLAAYHYNQHIIAITHLFVIGFIYSVVMGAMYQLVPVALETRLYSERLARWQYLCHLIGFCGMVMMFWTWNLKQVGHFGLVFTLGAMLFGYNLTRTLWRVPRWNVVATAVASALVWLCLAALAGLTIAAGKYVREMDAEGFTVTGFGAVVWRSLQPIGGFTARFDPMSAMHAHAHLGVVGVFLMLIIGISYKLVPMFTLSEQQSCRRAATSVWLLNTGLLGTFFAVLTRSPLKFLGALLIVGGLGVYGIELVAILRARKRRALDWALRHFLTALTMLIPLSGLGLWLAWPKLPLTPLNGQLENLYGFLAIAGVVALAIIGMLFKITPFLVWYASYSGRIGLSKVPAMAELYSASLQVAGYWTYLTGLGVMSAGIVIGRAPAIQAGGYVLALSLGIFLANLMKILSHLIQPRSIPHPVRPVAQTTV